jgi:DNA-binding response OmpR family regulator
MGSDRRNPRGKSARKSILVVEDEPAHVQFYEYALGEDYNVFIAKSGEAALDALNIQGKIDLMVLDINLPGMSGMDVLKEMKKSYSSIPVMIVSASDGDEAQTLPVVGGWCEYLEKPFEVGELLDRVKTCLSKDHERSNFIRRKINE